MTRKEQLLLILMEECDEVSQRASKAIRFTCEEAQPGQDLTNAERIKEEFNDLLAKMQMLQEEGLFIRIIDEVQIAKKKAQVEKYLLYSKSLGTLI
jgi:NTP pyrophosphatase (non-canonical NTP hydrolase)